MNVVKDNKDAYNSMKQMINTTLKRWETSLINFGKVDLWHLDEDYNALHNFIAEGESRLARSAIRDCRDYAITGSYRPEVLLLKVQKAKGILNKSQDIPAFRGNNTLKSTRLAIQYVSTTRKLYREKLDCRNGLVMRDIDISLEDGITSRKVRRIVEKRMCQAYYRQARRLAKGDGYDRHYMKRATSFQLHNLGQKECKEDVGRTQATHWKKAYDPITGDYVYKKKMVYNTYVDAEAAAHRYMARNTEEAIPVGAYKCAFCGKWHIGHLKRTTTIHGIAS